MNRCAIFLDDADRLHYRRLLREACQKHRLRVHAYVLMDNHVHLLLASDRPGDVSHGMRDIGQAYAQAFNARHGRCGTLWQGRFKSCLVDSDRYMLSVIRYIELNPVRAALVAAPEEYRWSSVHAHLGKAHDPLLTQHSLYLALGAEPVQRQAAYAQWLRAGTSDEELVAVRQYIAQERALGDSRFQAMVEKALNRPATCRARGRPKAAQAADAT